MHPLLLLAALVAILVLISWYKRAPEASRRRFRNRGLLIGGGVLLLFALLTGRLHPLFAAIGALVPLAWRAIGLFQTFQSLRSFTRQMHAGASPGQTPGQHSEVTTAFLHMRLDHDTGAMEGSVLKGRFEGCNLSDLDLERLLELLAECKAQDRQSAALVEAWLDREFEDWREGNAGGGSEGDDRGAKGSGGGLDDSEARAILGVGADAGREEIIDAHRRLMQRMHPDRGGTDYLASRLNAARDLLLASLDDGA
ncbi:MAG: molecular chaperone DnaJ [Ectothiorhodospiraceae bacterium AqS1]|nr:molecular chaperone DnaJ [Ectothiorhodospiraceae bacterium AqS1]